MKEFVRNNSVDILRILFTFSIIIFHIFGIIDPKHQEFFYCRHARIIVEFFFIISGYFLYKTFLKSENINEIMLKKFFRLFPIVFVTIIIISIYKNIEFHRIIPDFFLLSAIGIGAKPSIAGYCWFVFPLFWVSWFYLSLLSMIKDKLKFNFLNIVLIYFSLVILASNNLTFSLTVQNIYNIFNSGILRGIVGIGLGILFAMNLENLGSLFKRNGKIIATFLELFLFSYLFAQLIFINEKYVISYSLEYILIFSLLFICFINKLGYFSQILNKFNIKFISKYCYAWYVAQCISQTFLQKESFSVRSYFILSISITVLSGIILYHLVEEPVNKRINNKIKYINSSVGGGNKWKIKLKILNSYA